MKYLTGENRLQAYIFPVSLDMAISQDNEVRLKYLRAKSVDKVPKSTCHHYFSFFTLI